MTHMQIIETEVELLWDVESVVAPPSRLIMRD